MRLHFFVTVEYKKRPSYLPFGSGRSCGGSSASSSWAADFYCLVGAFAVKPSNTHPETHKPATANTHAYIHTHTHTHTHTYTHI